MANGERSRMGAALSSPRRRLAAGGALALAAAAAALLLRSRKRALKADAEEDAKPQGPSDAKRIGAVLWPRWGRRGEAGRGQVQMVLMLLLAAVRTYLSHMMTL